MKNRIEFVKGRLSKQIFAAENNGFAHLGRVLRFALSANPEEVLPKIEMTVAETAKL